VRAKRRAKSLVTGDASRRALEVLEDGGMYLSPVPEDEVPEIPEDLTLLDDSGLMILFRELTAWADFAAGQAAVAAIDERAAQRVVDRIEAVAMKGGHGGKASDRVAFAKAAMASDPEVVEARDYFEEKYTYRKLVDVVLVNLERDVALVSRELTRRTSDNSSRKGRFSE
jgi:hypothetical protein